MDSAAELEAVLATMQKQNIQGSITMPSGIRIDVKPELFKPETPGSRCVEAEPKQVRPTEKPRALKLRRSRSSKRTNFAWTPIETAVMAAALKVRSGELSMTDAKNLFSTKVKSAAGIRSGNSRAIHKIQLVLGAINAIDDGRPAPERYAALYSDYNSDPAGFFKRAEADYFLNIGEKVSFW
jgi:hypothetical protein